MNTAIDCRPLLSGVCVCDYAVCTNSDSVTIVVKQENDSSEAS